jgi:two-component system chemotaxis response regulator CheY
MSDNILIVDDSASMRQMVNFTLSENGYNVTEATNGQEGLNKLNEIDALKLVVTDIHMPIMDGINFIKNVRAGAKHKFVPIIILTTESEENMQNEGKKAGASAWIVKPFTPEKLIETVKKIIK